MLSETLLTQGDAVRLLGVSTRTLERHRLDGTGPMFIKAGARVLYRPSDVDEWLNARRFTSSAEAKAAGK